jgi:uncharacterized protein YegP (UPF0339 family)
MYPDKKDQWRWTYYGSDGGEIGVSSESYATKQHCRLRVDLMMASGKSVIYAPVGT